MSQTEEKRNYAFDALRVAAISAVIMIHVSSRLTVEYDAVPFLIGNIFNSLSRFAVPVFAMITGALLLRQEKQLQTKDVFLDYALKTVLLFIFWSVVYALVFRVALPLKNGVSPDISGIAEALVTGHYHMWYLYMLTGFYLMLPLFRKFVRKENMRAVVFLVAALVAIQSLLPVADFLITVPDGLSVMSFYEKSGLRTFFGFHMFFLLGWVISNLRTERVHRIVIYISGALCLAMTVIFTQLISEKNGEAFTELYNSLYLNNVITSVAVFILFCSLFGKKKDIHPFFKAVSRLSFGIYIVHPIVLEMFCAKHFMPSSPLLYIASLWLITAAGSFALCLVASKIPIVKKLIRA